MHRYDLALYGHLTIDKVFNDRFEQSSSLGAMGNVWGALVSIGSGLSIDLQPTAIGEAIILIDERRGYRLGRGKLNLKTRSCKPTNARWHHVMYINQLTDVEFVKDIDGIISADITSGPLKNVEALKYVDYLFISDEDLSMDLAALSELVRGVVVLHYPAGSIVFGGESEHKASTEVLDGLNVLGAGDMFAACFISYKLMNPDCSHAECIKYAHKTTTDLLLERKCEKES